jgi:hypothetical protein
MRRTTAGSSSLGRTVRLSIDRTQEYLTDKLDVCESVKRRYRTNQIRPDIAAVTGDDQASPVEHEHMELGNGA